MGSNSIKNYFKNVSKQIRKIHDILMCQACFRLRDEDSTFFYWKCSHFFCTDCVDKDKPCVICCDSQDELKQEWKHVKLSENKNILEIFRLVSKYESDDFCLDEFENAYVDEEKVVLESDQVDVESEKNVEKILTSEECGMEEESEIKNGKLEDEVNAEKKDQVDMTHSSKTKSKTRRRGNDCSTLNITTENDIAEISQTESKVLNESRSGLRRRGSKNNTSLEIITSDDKNNSHIEKATMSVANSRQRRGGSKNNSILDDDNNQINSQTENKVLNPLRGRLKRKTGENSSILEDDKNSSQTENKVINTSRSRLRRENKNNSSLDVTMEDDVKNSQPEKKASRGRPRKNDKNNSVMDVTNDDSQMEMKISVSNGRPRWKKNKNKISVEVTMDDEDEIISQPGKRGRPKRSDMNNSILDISMEINSQKGKKGLNVSKRNHKGETPLHLACRKGKMDLIEELITAGANPNIQDNAGWTPLHDSVAFGRRNVIKYLLENGARVNTPGYENATPLHQAVAQKNCEVAILLLEYGANKHAKNIYGETPIDLMKKYNYLEMGGIMMTTPVKYKTQSRKHDTGLLQGNAVLYGFNLNDEESALLKTFADQFKCKIVDRLLAQSSPTHIVTSDPEPKITWSIIPGVLMACHVLNTEWLKTSITEKSVQNIEKYEMVGEPYSGFVKSRQNRTDQFPGLFSGCHFYLGGNFELYKTKNSTFLKTELKILVEKNGGVVLSRNPDPESLALEKTIPYHAKEGSSLSKTSYYIIYSVGSWNPVPKYNMEHMKTLPVEWLLASIYKFELIDPKVDESYMEYI